MTLMTYEQTDFQNLPDQPTLRAVFNIARQLPEADIARNTAWLAQHAGSNPPPADSRPSYERMFAAWMNEHKIITSLPDLDKDAMTRVVALNLIEGTALMATNPYSPSPASILAAMKQATAESPQAAFFHAAIAEQEDLHNNKPWPQQSVAHTEYRIIDMKNAILKADRYSASAEFYKTLKRDTVHPNEYKWWSDTINGFDQSGPDKMPPTLYKQAQDAVEKLRLLKADFRPA